jgi:hypothetical protein
MEREVFSNPEIAAYMNAHFVNIKVDREERPDVDAVYMEATHLLTGSGGWPNSVFLTPDGKPFFAGSYFPPEDRHGRPAFPRVLRALQAAWATDRERVLDVAGRVTQAIASVASFAAPPGTKPPAADEVLRLAIDQLSQGYDSDQGGFGSRTKFPRPSALELLLTSLERKRQPEVERMLTHTLDAMALGGIYDHLAGGFHRYATEPTWSIPHFEKMLYDNAQLVGVYARAYALLGRPLYRQRVEQTLAYLDREMSHPEGGFVSAQDAEVDGREGASYVWTQSEIEQVLGKERAKAFLAVYALAPTPENPALGVLRVRPPGEGTAQKAGVEDVAARLARFDRDRAALLAQREKRPQPLRDDKMLADWNGLAIRGLVEAAKALDRPEYLRRAERAARFVLDRLRVDDGSLRRSYIAGQAREVALLDDYAFLADGLLALHEITGNPRWLAEAQALGDVLLERFEDPIAGGFFLTPEGSTLLVRPKPFEDSALPSGNAVAYRVLGTLAARTGADRYEEAANRTTAAAAQLLQEAPSALSSTVAALAQGSHTARPRVAEKVGNEAPAPEESRLPKSADHVRASLARSEGTRDRLVVRLVIDEGWHVNANPASFPFLIPTEVQLDAAAPSARVHYPPGSAFRPAFAPDAIQVYEGTLEIPVELGSDADPPSSVGLRFQACDASRCLPPGRIDLTLEKAGS